MTITTRQRRQLARVLGKFQGMLETTIHSAINRDGEVSAEIDRKPVEAARRDWREAEEWVKRLTV